jgi:hypothetical protein
MNRKLESLIDEFCKKGNLFQFKSVLGEIISSIFESNCSIYCCDTCETSSIEQSKDGTYQTRIRISFKRPKEKSIHYIWDILHEFGHHLSGLPNGIERTIERESKAWELGLIQLRKYPELIEHEHDYIRYQKNCLKTYK